MAAEGEEPSGSAFVLTQQEAMTSMSPGRMTRRVTAIAAPCELGGDAHRAAADGIGSPTAEAELVADFTASEIFRAAFSNADSHKKPNTLASIERRWFVGKQTKRSADALAAGLRGVSSVQRHAHVQLRLAGMRG
eukprot:COSAG02_NODE_9071_length_2342_cov_2.438252_1_plen_135_part_00